MRGLVYSDSSSSRQVNKKPYIRQERGKQSGLFPGSETRQSLIIGGSRYTRHNKTCR